MLYVMLFCRYPFERPDDEHEQPTKKYQKARFSLKCLALRHLLLFDCKV